jgi:hypothetical protein
MKSALPLVICALAMSELGGSRNAQACTRPLLVEFAIDPALVGRDLRPPSAPAGVTGSASRTSGVFCRGNECTFNTCGSQVDLRLEFQPALDDRTTPPGYQLRFREGFVPPELEGPLSRVFVGAPPLHVEILEGFEAVVALDASFELVALDRAGNESAASEPFRLAFNGCTQIMGQDGCAEDRATLVTCSNGGCVEAASESESGCALALGSSAPGVPASAGRVGLGLAGCALLLRRRRRGILA